MRRSSNGEGAPGANEELLRLVNQHLALDFDEPQHANDCTMSRADREMLGRQQASVRRAEGGKYEVGMLWKRPPSELPNNRPMASRSLATLGKRLLRDPELCGKYGTFLDAMDEQGQSERAPLGGEEGPDARPRVPTPPANSAPTHARKGPPRRRGIWYLLHHPVGPKFRVVFNGAAEFEGQALNGCLDKGPEHSSTLLGAFIRWRTYAKAACADIKGMFYNVSLPSGERDCVRYLWW